MALASKTSRPLVRRSDFLVLIAPGRFYTERMKHGIPKILVLMDPPQLREVLLFNIEARLGIEFLDPHSDTEAVDLLVGDETIDLVIADLTGGWAGFMKYSTQSKRKPKFALITSPGSPPLPPGFESLEEIPKDKVLERLPVFLSAYLLARRQTDEGSEPGEAEEEGLDPEFCRIKTQLLLAVSPLKADIYIRLSSSKYIKLFLKGDVFDHADLDHYMEQKQVRHLYIRMDETADFLLKFDQMLASLLQTKDLSPTVATAAATRALDTVHELGIKMGFTPEVEKIFKTNVALVIKTVSANVKLASLLTDLVKDRTSYIATHSVAVAQVGCAIAAEMDWRSESTFQKLTTAAMLHDIVLKNQKIARVRSETELEQRKSEFTENEVSDYPSHSSQAADLARSFSEMPADVDQVIQQHHESPDGTGFPKGLSANRISPLASLFIIAHDLVDEVIDQGDAFTLEGFIQSRQGAYSGRNFKKVMIELPKAKISFRT